MSSAHRRRPCYRVRPISRRSCAPSKWIFSTAHVSSPSHFFPVLLFSVLLSLHSLPPAAFLSLCFSPALFFLYFSFPVPLFLCTPFLLPLSFPAPSFSLRFPPYPNKKTPRAGSYPGRGIFYAVLKRNVTCPQAPPVLPGAANIAAVVRTVKMDFFDGVIRFLQCFV